jgi:hypothetical protein
VPRTLRNFESSQLCLKNKPKAIGARTMTSNGQPLVSIVTPAYNARHSWANASKVCSHKLMSFGSIRLSTIATLTGRSRLQGSMRPGIHRFGFEKGSLCASAIVSTFWQINTSDEMIYGAISCPGTQFKGKALTRRNSRRNHFVSVPVDIAQERLALNHLKSQFRHPWVHSALIRRM